MAWTQPKTWANEPLVAGDMNTHLRDNLEALKDPPSENYELDEASDYSTTSTSFVDVDGTNLSLSITTNGGDVLVHFHGVIRLDNNSASARSLAFDVDVDGSPQGGDDGIAGYYVAAGDDLYVPVSFTRLISGLDADSHTFKLQWKISAANCVGYLYAGAGTTYLDLHSQFWVREVS